jgi:hypothetical protein
MWSYGPGWTTEEFVDGPHHYCVTTSDARTSAGTEYKIAMRFGHGNEFALLTSTPTGTSHDGVLDIEGGGLNLGDVQYRREGKYFVAANGVSGAMFRKVIDDFRLAHSIAFDLNGKHFLVPVADPEKTYGDMIECQRSLLGLIIGDLK